MNEKKENCLILLLDKLIENNIHYLPDSIMPKDLIQLDKNIVSKILNVDIKEELIPAIELGLVINKDKKKYDNSQIEQIFTGNKFKAKKNIVECDLLNTKDKLYNIIYINSLNYNNDIIEAISRVMSNEDVIKSGKSLESVNILENTENKHKLYYCEKVLSNKKLIGNNTSIIGAKLIKKANDYTIDYMYDILIDDYMIENDMSIKCANIVSNAKNKNCAKYASKILLSMDKIGMPMAIYGARVAINKEKYSEYKLANYTEKYIEDSEIINAQLSRNNSMSIDSMREILDNQKNNNSINEIKLGRQLIKNLRKK